MPLWFRQCASGLAAGRFCSGRQDFRFAHGEAGPDLADVDQLLAKKFGNVYGGKTASGAGSCISDHDEFAFLMAP
jgi:hypothetical protein